MSHALLLTVLAFTGRPAHAAGIESLRLRAEQDFRRAPQTVRPDPTSSEPILQPPLVPVPLNRDSALGAELGRVDLAAQLDRNFKVASRVFGARALDMGVATDPGFKNYFVTFSDAKSTVLAALGDLDRLRGSGVNLRIDANTVYNFRVSVNYFNPVRGSTLKMSPVVGGGPSHGMKTGAILDGSRARAALFSANGQEYWLFYGRDVLPDGSGFAEDRSFLFVREAGLSSKAWPLKESALAADVPAIVSLGGTRLSLTRTAGGLLVIHAAP